MNFHDPSPIINRNQDIGKGRDNWYAGIAQVHKHDIDQQETPFQEYKTLVGTGSLTGGLSQVCNTGYSQ